LKPFVLAAVSGAPGGDAINPSVVAALDTYVAAVVAEYSTEFESARQPITPVPTVVIVPPSVAARFTLPLSVYPLAFAVALAGRV